jgi:hypothetical protein
MSEEQTNECVPNFGQWLLDLADQEYDGDITEMLDEVV